MVSHDPAAPTQARDAYERKAYDKSQSAPRGGSIATVLLVAAVLIAAAGGLIYVNRDYVEAYVLILLAVLGTIGVFALFAAAAGIVKFAARDQGNPLLKAVVDSAFDGILVTDHAGRVFYANANYLDLIGATGMNDVRPIERVFIGDPDVSEFDLSLAKGCARGTPAARGSAHRGQCRRGRPLASHACAAARRDTTRRSHDGVVDRRCYARA